MLAVTGYDPTGGTGYRPTSIQRTPGWHHLEIVQFRDLEHLNTAEFYVDGVLALRQTDVADTALSRVVLGLGWSGNPSQTGYTDDITVQIVPEPDAFSLALAGAATAAAFRRKGRTRGRRGEIWGEFDWNEAPRLWAEKGLRRCGSGLGRASATQTHSERVTRVIEVVMLPAECGHEPRVRARKVRNQYPGAVYHVMKRNDRREAISADDEDRQRLLETLGEAFQKTGWQVHAYCLMRNHFHLVVETPNAATRALVARIAAVKARACR